MGGGINAFINVSLSSSSLLLRGRGGGGGERGEETLLPGLCLDADETTQLCLQSCDQIAERRFISQKMIEVQGRS